MSDIANYKNTLDYLYRQLPMYQRDGKSAFKKNLDNIKALCAALDNPERKFKCIHIAGTNGKGSVAHMLSAMYQSKYEKIGLYTSPHYVDFRERIKINNLFIAEQDVIQFVEKIQSLNLDIQPSFFEITVAMAFDYFAQQTIDLAIIETGLGGRLDSTNVILPKLSIITNIGLDHMDMLGDTIAAIASEKAGIIKNHTPVLIGEWHQESHPVFAAKAKEMNARMTYADDLLAVRDHENINQKYWESKVNDAHGTISFNYVGAYQNQNLKTAIAATILWNDKYPDDRLDLHYAALQLSRIHELSYYIGRGQILQRQPILLVDSAHNTDGFEVLLDTIKTLSYQRLHFVLGFVKDKAVSDILKQLPDHALLYLTQAKIARAMDVSHLHELVNEYELEISHTSNDVVKATNRAISMVDEDDLIVVCGSIFVVAEVIAHYQDKQIK